MDKDRTAKNDKTKEEAQTAGMLSTWVPEKNPQGTQKSLVSKLMLDKMLEFTKADAPDYANLQAVKALSQTKLSEPHREAPGRQLDMNLVQECS